MADVMDEKEIMKLITSDFSWEQVIYKVIAWEGLNPWDLDLKLLTDSFMKHLEKMDRLDFKIPAKYLIIAAVLLRMKSDHLHFLEVVTGAEEELPDLEAFEPDEMDYGAPQMELNPITAPPKRFAKRQVMVNELIGALRRAMTSR